MGAISLSLRSFTVLLLVSWSAVLASANNCTDNGPFFVEDIDAQVTDSPVTATFSAILGHVVSGYNLADVSVSIVSSDQSVIRNADISVTGTGSQRVISAQAIPKSSGDITLKVTLADQESRCSIQNVAVKVRALEPRFGLSSADVTLVTRPLTSTFPFRLVFGHGDELKLNQTVLSVAVDDTSGLLDNNGVVLTMNGDRFSEQQGLLNIAMTSANLVVTPSKYPATSAKSVSIGISITASDGQLTTSISITVRVDAVPSMTGWCEHVVQLDETLASIASTHGMHWTTLFLMNNQTVLNPRDLSPGTRLSLGRPYIVQPKESLHQIATKFGTSWEVLLHINQPLLVDGNSVYEGALICVAPGLHQINCRHIW